MSKAMEDPRKYFMRLNCGGPPVQVKEFKTPIYPDGEEQGVFCVRRSITFCVGKRFCAFDIIEKCKNDIVYSVNIEVREQFAESSGAQTSMWFVRNNRYDVLCSVRTLSSGSYESFRRNYSAPSLPDIETTGLFCHMSGCGSFFTLEKKKFDASEVVERVKTTHAFLFGGDETLSVKVKITNDRKVGLRVEVERPVKLTLDYSYSVFEKMEEKMEREIRNNVLSILRNVSDRDSGDKHNKEPYLQTPSLVQYQERCAGPRVVPLANFEYGEREP
ncbi:hypothetical protein VNO80_20389 [Phaseolus coccineus]|uniref:Uncharacterized protein n=1 Tax=Phaseolus coccineus TaxID=3886 RepID=A0AAN9ML76_PHACN